MTRAHSGEFGCLPRPLPVGPKCPSPCPDARRRPPRRHLLVLDLPIGVLHRVRKASVMAVKFNPFQSFEPEQAGRPIHQAGTRAVRCRPIEAVQPPASSVWGPSGRLRPPDAEASPPWPPSKAGHSGAGRAPTSRSGRRPPTQDGQPSGAFDMKRVVGHAARQGIGPAARAIDDGHGHAIEEARIEELEVPPAPVGIEPEIHRVPKLDLGLEHPGEGPTGLASRSDQHVSPDIAQGIPREPRPRKSPRPPRRWSSCLRRLAPSPRGRRLLPRGSDVPGGEHHDALAGMMPGHVLRQEGHRAALLREGIEHARRVHHERAPRSVRTRWTASETGPGAHRLQGWAPEGPTTTSTGPPSKARSSGALSMTPAVSSPESRNRTSTWVPSHRPVSKARRMPEAQSSAMSRRRSA